MMIAGAALLAACSLLYPSSYYRVTAKLMHDGEPVTIDWVVECRYTPRWGEMRGYTRVSYVPVVIGVKTNDGGMVLMVSPAYCGKTETKTDDIPFLMWGDKAGDFSFFTAYVAKAAFDNPASRLKVISVVLRPSTYSDYAAWKRTAPKNVVPAKGNPFLADSRGYAASCFGLSKMPVRQALHDDRGAVTPLSSGTYWIASLRLVGEILRENGRKSEVLGDGWGLGLAEQRFPYPTYPLGNRDYFQRHFLQTAPSNNSGVDILAIDEALDGFMSCGALPLKPEDRDHTRISFSDGITAPVIFNAIDSINFIKGSETAYLTRIIQFNIERGDDGDE